jgi:hypothetical protein
MSGGSLGEQAEDINKFTNQGDPMLNSASPVLAALVTQRQEQIKADFAGIRADRDARAWAATRHTGGPRRTSLRHHIAALLH